MPPSPDILAALSPVLDQALDLSPEELRILLWRAGAVPKCFGADRSARLALSA
jgi:hypothetical protein